MRKPILCLILFLIVAKTTKAQVTLELSKKVSVLWHPNIETYFIAERLAVQNIDHMVFTRKDSLYKHQPLVYNAYERFKSYENDPSIKRISTLIATIRDNLHDNAQVLQYLLYLETFPKKGEAIPFRDSIIFNTPDNKDLLKITKELSDSLHSFYIKANVGSFLRENKHFYEGSLKEVEKDVQVKAFGAMEQYYGESFAAYRIYLMPTMPIPYGPDNYRAFGPTMRWPQGRISAMLMSSSRPLQSGKPIKNLTTYGFDNHDVTHFLTIHEISHSFVNPHIPIYEKQLEKKSDLFTPALQKALEPSYIGSWYTCVIEHLVRLGEIRTATAMGDIKEADRLRKMHIKEFHFVLLPILERKIIEYETHRNIYPDFKSFLPNLLSVFDELNPKQVDELLKK